MEILFFILKALGIAIAIFGSAVLLWMAYGYFAIMQLVGDEIEGLQDGMQEAEERLMKR